MRDDGRSADVTEPIRPHGGLLGMRERAELLGGSLRVQRLDPFGLQVDAHLPRGGAR